MSFALCSFWCQRRPCRCRIHTRRRGDQVVQRDHPPRYCVIWPAHSETRSEGARGPALVSVRRHLKPCNINLLLCGTSQGKSWANRCSTRVRLVLSLDLAASLLSEGESKERPSPAIRPTGGVVASCKPPDSKTCPSTQVRTHFALFPIDNRLARGCHAFLSLSRWLGLLKRCRAKAAAPAFDPAELGLN